ncbi:MAG: prolipoprotein diacylglyceryl transferase [Candidatus Zixiibacteriota bacterium]|nr:MAG: prolipoprotein diacylglyceryl transferase [candidate division Zixibacteria bacterium]
MHPILFEIGPFPVRSYGFALALSFFLAIVLSLKRAKRFQIPPQLIMELALVVLVTALLGSRLFYVVYHIEEFQGHWWDIFNPFQGDGRLGMGGLSMMGGVILSVLCGLLFLARPGAKPWFPAAVAAPTFALAVGITRLGCFLNGCCFGVPTDSSLGMVFPADSFAGYVFPDQHIWPAQLFASAVGFFIFVLLLLFERRKKFDGQIFLLMVIFYSLGRFVIDFFRYYEESMVFVRIQGVSFSTNQALIVPILIVSLVLWQFLKRRRELPSEKL